MSVEVSLEETALASTAEGCEPPVEASGIAPRLYERAFDILAGQIAAGILLPGERLLESRVADRFGISRAPARQALARLERVGLVRRRQGQGFVVEPLSGPLPVAPVSVGGEGPVQLVPEQSWERIYKSVEQEVVSRTAFGGFRVVENHLAAHFGVSRTVAREVLTRLQQRGVVKKDPRLHWYAPALTPAYVAELFEMRAVLEPAALKRAYPRLPTETLPVVRRRLFAALERPDSLTGSELSALEADLHVQMLGHCGNATLMEALSTYQGLLVALTFLYRWAPHFYACEPLLAEHLAVVDRMAAGDPDAAAGALTEHLRNSFGRAMERLDRVRREFVPGTLAYLAPL